MTDTPEIKPDTQYYVKGPWWKIGMTSSEKQPKTITWGTTAKEICYDEGCTDPDTNKVYVNDLTPMNIGDPPSTNEQAADQYRLCKEYKPGNIEWLTREDESKTCNVPNNKIGIIPTQGKLYQFITLVAGFKGHGKITDLMRDVENMDEWLHIWHTRQTCVGGHCPTTENGKDRAQQGADMAAYRAIWGSGGALATMSEKKFRENITSHILYLDR